MEYIIGFLNEKFDEELPLAKKGLKLPIVLSREEINKMVGVTSNIKHKLILMFLYYAGLRLGEARNLKWEDIDFNRDIIHIKTAKGEKERVVFLHPKLKGMLEIMALIRKDWFSNLKWEEIRCIQQLLGHKGLRATQIYTHAASKNIKKLANLL